MTWPHRSSVALAVVAAALGAPGVAFAHAGKSPPVATNFTARITHPIPGVQTKAVDGDQTLWLDAGAHTVAIPGIQGEPLLRFDRRGVWLNLRSLTAQADQIDRYDLRPDANPHAAPLWHHLTGAHGYEWHEHRLHLLEPLAKGLAKPATLGTWTIPLIVDGRHEALVGVLDYQPPPPMLVWIGITALLAAVGAFVAWHSSRTTVLLALAVVPTVWALRIARELYGRPTVPVIGWIEIALTSLVGAALLYGLLHTDRAVRIFVALLTAFGALYQGATMYPVLTRAIALTLLPTTVARVGVMLALSLGVASLVGSWNPLAERRHAHHEDESLEDVEQARGAEPMLSRSPDALQQRQSPR
jgi:hypothetical protein